MAFTIKKTKKQLLSKSAAHKKFHADETVLVATPSAPAIVNDLVPALVIERPPINKIKPAKKRARRASKNHLANVIKAIQSLGQVAPILIDAEGRIVDGHVVFDALKALGETHVNVVRLDHLDEDQLRLVRITLNKLAEGSEWDLEELRAEFEQLDLAGYDLSITGFPLPEIDIIRLNLPGENEETEAQEPIEVPIQPVSQLGDLWEMGKHHLLCGDSLLQASYEAVLGSRKAQVSFTDCPWNIPIEGFVSGVGSTKHKDFKMAAGEMSNEAFQAFCDTFTTLIAEWLEDGGVLFNCIDWRSDDKIIAAGRKAGLKHINTIIWDKGSGGMGGLYRSAHELIPTFCKGKSPKTNNIQLGKHGRDRTNVWRYPGANRRGTSAAKALKDHPTPKPVELVADALRDVTIIGDVVLDPFLGSGTTLLAAQRTGRVAAGIELDPKYVDVCIRRWEEMTGNEAVLASTGQTFAEVAAIRAQVEPETQGEKINVA